ncbi:MAG: primosomal protein N', partial [Verrucomicrobia bacterium]|nr:primosomal protein N' [Verrucomicrobiota bacterium]
MFARVIIDRSADREFDYRVPPALVGLVQVGSRVRVPFRERAAALGTVVDLPAESPVPAEKLRPLAGALHNGKPILSTVLITMARWMADYYCCAVETAMRAVLPQVIREAAVNYKKQLHARLLRLPSNDDLATLKKRAPRQAELLEALARNALGEPVAVAPLLTECGATHTTLNALAKAGWLVTAAAAVARDPYEGEQFLASPPQTLSADQAAALLAAREALDAAPGSAGKRPILLHGVTGSGKTEVYLQ